MDCKSEIKTEFPDSPNSGHEENNSVQTAGPDIKHFVKTETYDCHDLVDGSLDYQSNNYNSELQAASNEMTTKKLVNEMEIKEEKLFHFQESLDIKIDVKAEPELEKPLNFDLSDEELQGVNVESMEFDQGI